MNEIISLADGVERAAQHPKTFRIPTQERRQALAIGHLAKLMFESAVPAKGRFEGATGERMWVRVESIERSEEGAITYVGKLTNTPAFLPMDCGDEVRFEPRHVIDIDENN
jgi:hypothetical protein